MSQQARRRPAVMDRVEHLARRIEGRSGMPAWAAAPLAGATVSLLVALFGVFWDVAYHIDFGRDANLFTAAHLMILFGLTGLGASAAVSVLFATATGAAPAWRILGLRLPYAALPLGLMGGAAMVGFPLDDLWHRTYGIDVTLWSPTHLLMIGGAVFSTIAVTMLAAQVARLETAGLYRKVRNVSLCGALVIGPSVLMLEFDFGVPQWQAVYHPILVGITTGFGLVAARVILGRFGALAAGAWFVGMRLLLMLFVHANGLTAPVFPLVLPSAALVELAFALPGLALPARAVVAGGLAGTLGMAVEWAWTQAVYPMPLQPHLLARMWMPLVAAIASAVLGAALGAVATGRRGAMPPVLVATGLAGVIAMLALPLPRNGSPAVAHMRMTPVGDARAAADRYGRPSAVQDVQVDLAIDPASAAAGADWIDVLAWQGGGHHVVRLRSAGPGQYHAEAAVPTGAAWKAIVLLGRDDVVASVPVSFPADPEYRRGPIAPVPAADRPFRPATELITSESHGGAPAVAVVAYAALLLTLAAWIASTFAAGRAIVRGAASAPGGDLTAGARRRRPSLG